MKQLIIARKDLNMSAGKLAAQVSHASMSFLSNMIRKKSVKTVLNIYFTTSEESGKPIIYSDPTLDDIAVDEREKGEQSFFANKVGDSYVKVDKPILAYRSRLIIDKDLYEEWLNGAFTKVICEAKNKNQLLKAVDLATELGLVEGEDFFLIRDNCLTELEAEEFDENDIGRTLTCIGFRPLPDDVAHLISKKYQLFH